MQMGTSNWSVLEKCEPRRPAGYETGVNVSKLCENGHLTEAVEALGVRVQTHTRISKSLLYTVLKSCVAQKDLILGRRIHALTVRKGYESDTFLCNHILRMYASHGRLQEAIDVFTVVPKPDAFMWSSIISAHVKQGKDKQAIELYHQMRRSSVQPDGHVFVAALQACARGADLESGQQVHSDVIAGGAELDLFVCSSLVDMYAKCGSLEDAQRVFDGLGHKDVVTWNAMIAGFSQQGMGAEALRLYSAMEEEGVASPDSVTFVSLLQACASVGTSALQKGRQLHGQLRECGHDADVILANSLINMYAKCGSLEDAERVFDRLDHKDVVTWSAMIAAYAQQGMGQKVLRLYSAMEAEGIVALDSVTFVCLLQAFASVGSVALEKGKNLHAQVRERGHQADVPVANTLVYMYAKCGSLEDAQRVFDSMDSPDSVTFVCLLQAYANSGAMGLEKGRQLHAQIKERGLEGDAFLASSLVSTYAKCGSLEDAQRVFDGLGQKDVVTWNAMIAGYCQQGMGQEALNVYAAMVEEGSAVPTSVTFVCLLQACADVAALQVGKYLHAQIQEQRLQADLLVAGSLIHMYGKAGSMVDAYQVFEALAERDIVTWNALIAGYTRQGDSAMVFGLVKQMRHDGIHPDGITFISVLTVCSHAGLVSKGKEYFEAMSRHYGIPATVDHYTCMVDLLGRAGRLDEALALVRTISVLPNAAVWHTLLGACRKWSNIEVACNAFDEAVKLDNKDAAAYALMSNIYIGAQMWEQAQEMQVRRLRIRAWKQPGQSWWTDMDGLVHSFLVGEASSMVERNRCSPP